MIVIFFLIGFVKWKKLSFFSVYYLDIEEILRMWLENLLEDLYIKFFNNIFSNVVR